MLLGKILQPVSRPQDEKVWPPLALNLTIHLTISLRLSAIDWSETSAVSRTHERINSFRQHVRAMIYLRRCNINKCSVCIVCESLFHANFAWRSSKREIKLRLLDRIAMMMKCRCLGIVNRTEICTRKKCGAWLFSFSMTSRKSPPTDAIFMSQSTERGELASAFLSLSAPFDVE